MIAIGRSRLLFMFKPTRLKARPLCAAAVVLCAPAGCGSANWIKNGLIDPTQVGNFTAPVRLEIREHVSLLEEPLGIQDAEEPAPADLVAEYSEVKIGPGDVIRISIFELLAPRLSTDLQIQVRSSGMETLPTLGYVRIAGYTPRELELELKRLLADAQILQDAEVQVTVLRSEYMQFSVVGNVRQSGNYPLPRPDFRMQNVIALVGTLPEQLESIYVFRNAGGDAPFADVPPPAPQSFEDDELPAPITMSDFGGGHAQDPPATAPSGVDELEILEGTAEPPQGEFILDPDTGEWRMVTPATTTSPDQPSTDVPVIDGESPVPVAPPDVEGHIPEDRSEAAELAPRVRIIEIPVKALMEGDPRYNIVIRPQDMVHVPLNNFGEYYVGGNVNRPGAFQLTGRKITVKQAIVSAGQFGPLAWPSRADLVRRVSGDEEQTIQVDLDAIFAGKAPDFYLRPNDMIHVSSHPIATFLAVLRNAFRFTYGFGFVYDRNYADADTFQAQEQIRARRRAESAARGLPF